MGPSLLFLFRGEGDPSLPTFLHMSDSNVDDRGRQTPGYDTDGPPPDLPLGMDLWGSEILGSSFPGRNTLRDIHVIKPVSLTTILFGNTHSKKRTMVGLSLLGGKVD